MRRLVPAVLVLLLLAAGCGGDGADEAAPTAAPAGEGAEGEPTGAPPVSLPGSVSREGTVDKSGAGTSFALEVDQDDFSFAPTFVEAAPGARVTVELRNVGEAEHTFTIEALGIDEVLDPGASAEVVVELPEDGPVRFVCRFHEDRGMQGAFFFEASGEGTEGTGADQGGAGSGY